MNFLIKTSRNLYLFWNIGFILSIRIIIQIIIGFLLSTRYFFFSTNLFNNSFFIYYNINFGWLIRFIHRNLTSTIFIIIFIHILRRIIYKNYINKKIWNTGILILLILIIVSFLGYSLIWSQIAYWASIVITNFIATIPIFGNNLIILIWGNQFINNILINRFFSIHFILALIIIIISIIHLILLHINKSTNPLNINNNIDQINLNPIFIFKDLFILTIYIYIFLIINFLSPLKINNPDNFNSIIIFKTPTHIEPEWYFLFFYSILRSINDKFNGLLIIINSILIWFTIPLINKTKFISNKFIFINKLLLWIIIIIIVLTTFLGSKTSKFPYTLIIKILLIIYFFIFFILTIRTKIINY